MSNAAIFQSTPHRQIVANEVGTARSSLDDANIFSSSYSVDTARGCLNTGFVLKLKVIYELI